MAYLLLVLLPLTCYLYVVISGQVARCIYERKRRMAAATTIQKGGRMFSSRKAYTILRTSAIVIQTGIRGMAARRELLFRKQNKAAIAIQVILCQGNVVLTQSCITFSLPILVDLS